MESCEKVFTNADLLTLIFKYLSFEDQLKLAQVNDQLRYAFEVLSGNVNYTSLCIVQVYYSIWRQSIIVAGEMGVNSKYLQSEEVLHDFLNIYAERVKDLTLWTLKSSLGPYLILWKFRNLRRLTTYKMHNMDDWVYEIPYPADLEELNVVDCFGDSDRLVNQIIDKEMKNLHKLEIVYRNETRVKNYFSLDHRHWPKLESLKLNICSYAADVSLQAASNLKQIYIELVDVNWLNGLPLSNLKVLHLELYRTAENVFPVLTESCANLESLTLSNVYLGGVTTLSLPPKMTELSFHNCSDLAHSCLKRILSDFKIIKFCSRGTRYIGEFHDFQISSHIQSLEIDFIHIAKFRSAYENNSQLKELIWPYLAQSEETDYVSFNRTPNLQRLDIPYISAVGALTHLNSIQSLKLICPHTLIKCCDIVDLLKLPTLRELCICNAIDTRLSHFQPSVLPPQTNITRLIITENMLKKWMNFWLELFSTNMHMTLVCCLPFALDADELRLAEQLVHHEIFPRKLKTMDVCCFTIDCKELRRDYDGVSINFPVFDYDDEEIAGENLKMARRRRIVLSWKYEFIF